MPPSPRFLCVEARFLSAKTPRIPSPPTAEWPSYDAARPAWRTGRDIESLQEAPLLIRLTPQEERLLQLLIGGASNRVAAKELGVALRTMELRRQKVMEKLGAKSAVQLGYLYAKQQK